MDNIGQKWDGLLILVKLGCTITGLTAPHLVRFLRRYYRGLSKEALIRRVHRALDRLEAKGLVTTEVVGKYRFARLTGEGLRLFWVAVDLKLMRKVRDVPVVNPIPEKIFKEYNRWLRAHLKV